MTTYKLLNTKDYHLYSGEFAFKAKTWEELRMLSENNECVEEMVRSLFKFNSDEQIREQCEDIEIELAARKALLKEHNIDIP